VVTSARRPAFPYLTLLLLGWVAAGCVTTRSQLREPVAADEVTRLAALERMQAAPLPTERAAQVAVEWNKQVFVAMGYFGVTPPDAFHAELATPFGVTLIDVARDADGAEVRSGVGPLRRALEMGEFHQLLGLWLLGDCDEGPVWIGTNGLAVDCPASGPDEGLTWRVWVEDGEAGPVRVRGELLKRQRLLADYTCDASGRCVLQDLVHRYALRVVPAAAP